ncbi:hypothetical protein [Aquabacterium humicola]|uniref:hypothetical protein n=1 Tax=Aquabacterium humicola TaxID=3237377 RepID=UPI0025433656|nr:hypothetical protein [Rubrivivax pictus]
MTARLRSSTPSPATGAAASPWAPAEAAADTPPLSQILAHYRRHGTLAGEIARAEGAPAPAGLPGIFREALDGLQMRELEGDALFDQYFGGR